MGRYQRNCGHMTLRSMSKPAELAELDPAFLKLNLIRTKSCPEEVGSGHENRVRFCLTEFIEECSVGIQSYVSVSVQWYSIIGTCYIDVSLHIESLVLKVIIL